MNRYKITFEDDTELLLYYQSEQEIIDHYTDTSFGKIKSVAQYTDMSHEIYIDKIKQLSHFLGYDYKNRECYECNYLKGKLIIKLSKDSTDNTYYDFAEYQEIKRGQKVYPVTFTMSTPKEVYELISQGEPKYIVYSHRYYGEPKLTRPKELKGIKSIGKAEFIPKHSNPQIFIKDNDIWIKHTDYFSSMWIPPKGEKTGMPLSYYANKYFNKNRSDKFVYPDCYGSIVLRNEAWIQLKNFMPLVEDKENIFVCNMIKEQSKDKYTQFGTQETINHWERFWENVYKVINQKEK